MQFKKSTTLLLSSAFICSLASIASADRPAPVAQTANGTVEGVAVNDAVAAYKGIRFAQPPVGALRWRSAQPIGAANATFKADRFGPACIQKTKLTPEEEAASGAAPSETSEDCLTLNVWAPIKHDKPLPVMVWIHGGGFVAGASSLYFYDGTSFARDGVILVSVNYRLGLLGFFAHPALDKSVGANETRGNYGLSDQLEALRWVQKNISGFGGDPSNVTVFGESAGGMSVLSLLAAPASKGLYAKAIIESGLGWHKVRTLAEAEADGAQIATAVGLPGVDATADALRAITPDALVAATPKDGNGPLVDGVILPEALTAAFAKGDVQHVPIIIGTNSNEGTLLRPAAAGTALLAALPPESVAGARAYYGAAANDDYGLARRLFRDGVFTAPARWVARQVGAAQPAYLYHFDYVASYFRSKSDGVAHGYEIPFVFDSWKHIPHASLILTDEDKAETALVHSCWVSFAKTGVPQCQGAPEWPKYTAQSDSLLDFTLPAAVVKTGFEKPMLDRLEAKQKSKDPNIN
jgi:para-nitrobenzyl esterase